MPAHSNHRQRGVAEAPVRTDEGQVEAIEIYRAPDNKPVNGGTLIGGIAGGVIGHQIGSGRGNTAATIAGTIAGAVVGNEIEIKQGQATRYRTTVRLDSGSSLIVEDKRELNLRVGDRVRIEDGHIHRI
jgi:outer membrane lipoprotein SlyB